MIYQQREQAEILIFAASTAQFIFVKLMGRDSGFIAANQFDQ